MRTVIFDGPELFLDYFYDKIDEPNQFYYRSDQYNFAKNNIPVIFYFSGVHADYHKPSDTADKMDPLLLQKRTELIFLTLMNLADMDKSVINNQTGKRGNKRD